MKSSCESASTSVDHFKLLSKLIFRDNIIAFSLRSATSGRRLPTVTHYVLFSDFTQNLKQLELAFLLKLLSKGYLTIEHLIARLKNSWTKYKKGELADSKRSNNCVYIYRYYLIKHSHTVYLRFWLHFLLIWFCFFYFSLCYVANVSPVSSKLACPVSVLTIVSQLLPPLHPPISYTICLYLSFFP